MLFEKAKSKGRAGKSKNGVRANPARLRSASSELSALRAKFAELYHSAPVGYLTLSDAGQIEEANLTVARLLGLSRRCLVGQPLVNFVADGDRTRWSKYLSELHRLRGQQRVELSLGRGEKRPAVQIEMVAGLAPNRRGKKVKFLAVIDITARLAVQSALRESEERFRRLASHAPVGIFLCDATGNNSYVNEMWCAMTGFSATPPIGDG